MNLKTHSEIENTLCGKLIKLEDSHAEVLLHTTQNMKVDTRGLVHGGFLFGAADYAAMCAVNDPYVVLGASNVKFISPVKVGDSVLCKADIIGNIGKKREVKVLLYVEDLLVFEGSFTAFILDSHVLD